MLNATLRPFQEEALQLMINRGSLLLAMTMGAGKTVTSIAACEHLLEAGEAESVLVIAPAPLKYQWQEEVHKFTDRHAFVIDGSPSVREIQYSAAWAYYYVITNYEAVVKDFDVYKAMGFDVIIIDEASFIKGFTANRSKAVKALGRHAKARFALTGTPIENRPEDLFSIMQFVDKTVLGRFDEFDRTFIVRDWYGKPKRYRNLKLLHSRMSEAMFRRSREDIQEYLPKISEKTIRVNASPAERALYKTIAADILDKMAEVMAQFGKSFSLTANYGLTGDDNQAMLRAQGEVMSMLLCLRLACTDASLIGESAANYDPEKGTGSKYAREFVDAQPDYRWPASTKLKNFVQFARQLLDEGPDTKIVVFSYFKGVLRSVRRALEQGNVLGPYTHAVDYNGDMNARQKDAAKKEFLADPNCRFFLSSDAGGYGVNLDKANYLISLDLPWSTGKLEQREARIIRLSSEFDHVTLVEMLMRGSVEERIHDMLEQKKGIADAWVDGKHDAKGRFDLTLSSLTKFLQESTV